MPRSGGVAVVVVAAGDVELEQATYLLRSTKLSVEVVASRVGYLGANTLREVVRRRRKMSLRELRDGPHTRHPHRPGDPDRDHSPGPARVVPPSLLPGGDDETVIGSD